MRVYLDTKLPGGMGIVPCDQHGETTSPATTDQTHFLVVVHDGTTEAEIVLSPRKALWLAVNLLSKLNDRHWITVPEGAEL